MRKNLVLSALVAASLALALSAQAAQLYTSAATGGTKGSAFTGGVMPSKIVNKPVDISGAAMPHNMQQAMMPQQQSTRVFNINSAFRSMRMPLFSPTVPAVPVVQPGKNNPIQPTNPIQLPPVKVQRSPVAPWYK